MNQDNVTENFLFKSPKELITNASLVTTDNQKSEVVYMAKQPQYFLDKDVILSAITKNQLEESLAKIKHHKTIYEDWGFGEVDKLGRSSILKIGRAHV